MGIYNILRNKGNSGLFPKTRGRQKWLNRAVFSAFEYTENCINFHSQWTNDVDILIQFNFAPKTAPTGLEIYGKIKLCEKLNSANK